MKKFFIEMTDTFAGEANYCWAKRFTVEANSYKGAVQKFAKHVGAGWRINFDSGDLKRYDNKGVCAFVEYYCEETHGNFYAESV